MALTSLQNNRGVPSFDDYFKMASMLDMPKLEAIIRGDRSVGPRIPVLAAMAAYEAKLPQQTAMQGQQAQQQLQQAQPTVRQEMIPDMGMLQQQQAGPQPPVLPEQAGVGALPAPNMQGMAMAHGGIIAFDDGGEVPGYAGRGAVKEELTEEEKRELEERERAYYESLIAPFSKAKKAVSDWWNKDYKPKTPGYKMPSIKYDYKTPGLEGARAGILDYEQAPQKLERLREEQGAAPVMPDQTAAETARLQRQAAPAAQPEYIDVPSRGTSPAAPVATPRKAMPAAPVAPAAPAPEKVGVENILEAQQAISSQGDAEVRGLLDKYGKSTAAGIEALKKEREVGKPTGEAYSAYEKALQKEETEAKGKEERNLQMALVNAGLGMMAGTSQYALENIGKGAMVGTKQYMDGIDKLEAAAKKRQEAMAMIENARRAEARGDWEKKNEFALKAFELDRGVQKANIDAISTLTGKNKEISAQLLNRAQQDEAAKERTLIETQSAERRTKEMAGAQRYAADKYGERQLNPAAAVKEANDTFNDWLRSAKGQMEALKPGAVEAKKRQILIDTFNAMGIPLPPGYASAPTRGNLPPLDPSTTPDLFK